MAVADIDSEDSESLVARILNEGPLGLSAAARKLGTFREDKTTHPSTLVRWHRHGIDVRGRRLRLEAIVLNGRLVTSWAAVIRFVEQQNLPTHTETGPVPPPRSPTARNRASDRAAAELESLGC